MDYNQIVSILVSATTGSIITLFVNFIKFTKHKLESDIKLKFKDYEHEKKLSAKHYLREEEINLLRAWGDIINTGENYNVSDVLISIYPDLREQAINH